MWFLQSFLFTWCVFMWRDFIYIWAEGVRECLCLTKCPILTARIGSPCFVTLSERGMTLSERVWLCLKGAWLCLKEYDFVWKGCSQTLSECDRTVWKGYNCLKSEWLCLKGAPHFLKGLHLNGVWILCLKGVWLSERGCHFLTASQVHNVSYRG